MIIFPSHITNCVNKVEDLLDTNSPFHGPIARMLFSFRKKILNMEIDLTIWKLKKLEKIILEARTTLLQELGGYSRVFLKYISISFRKFVTENMKSLNSKIKRLIQRRTQFDDHDAVLAFNNCTDLEFPLNVQRLLSFGPGFAVPFTPDKKQMYRIMADVENIARRDFEEDQGNRVRSRCVNIISNYVHHRKIYTIEERKILGMLSDTKRFLRTHKDVRITYSDKGNLTVAMYAQDYEKKMLELLSDTNTYKVLTKNPNNCTQAKNNDLIKTAFNQDRISIGGYHRCISHNPTTPRIYGLPKVHKLNWPMRPIVSFIDAPTYGTAAHLSDILGNITDKTKYYVRNSYELRDFIVKQKVPSGFGMVSLDVVSLFTNIPLKVVLKILDDKWKYIQEHTRLSKVLFFDLIKMCINSSYFSFRGKFYQMVSGMPMGSPLSPVIADLVMERLLDRVLPRLSFKPGLVKKYVDDLILTVPENKHDELLVTFNNYHNKLQFTLENEENKRIPFLDLMLIRDEEGEIITDWYKKKISTGRLLNFNSNHHISHKIGTSLGFAKRVFALSDDRFKKENENKIYQILTGNGYTKHFTRKIIEKAKYGDLNTTSKVIPSCFRSVIYINGLTEQLSKIIRMEDPRMGVGYKNVSSLRDLIFAKGKDRMSRDLRRNLVYKIDCNDCQQCYVGQTSCFLKTRMAGHRSDIKLKKCEKSPLAEHNVVLNHVLDVDGVEILSHVEFLHKRLFVEMCFIKEYDTINRLFDLENLNNCYAAILWRLKNID